MPDDDRPRLTYTLTLIRRAWTTDELAARRRQRELTQAIPTVIDDEPAKDWRDPILEDVAATATLDDACRVAAVVLVAHILGVDPDLAAKVITVTPAEFDGVILSWFARLNADQVTRLVELAASLPPTGR